MLSLLDCAVEKIFAHNQRFYNLLQNYAELIESYDFYRIYLPNDRKF